MWFSLMGLKVVTFRVKRRHRKAAIENKVNRCDFNAMIEGLRRASLGRA